MIHNVSWIFKFKIWTKNKEKRHNNFKKNQIIKEKKKNVIRKRIIDYKIKIKILNKNARNKKWRKISLKINIRKQAKPIKKSINA